MYCTVSSEGKYASNKIEQIPPGVIILREEEENKLGVFGVEGQKTKGLDLVIQVAIEGPSIFLLPLLLEFFFNSGANSKFVWSHSLETRNICDIMIILLYVHSNIESSANI